MSNSAIYPPVGNALGKLGMVSDVEDTPAGSTYSPQLTETGREHAMYSLNGTEKMKSAAFASKSTRPDPVLPNYLNPGPGTYDPKPDALQPALNNMLSKIGRDVRHTCDYIDGIDAS